MNYPTFDRAYDHTPKVDTLGDIRDRLQEMVDAGAHPGSIAWVLGNQVPCEFWPEGAPGNCDHCRMFTVRTGIRGLDHVTIEGVEVHEDLVRDLIHCFIGASESEGMSWGPTDRIQAFFDQTGGWEFWISKYYDLDENRA